MQLLSTGKEGADRRKSKALIDLTSRLTRGASGAVSWAETALEGARAALDALDREALRAVGVDLPSMGRPVPILTRRRPPLTSGAREALRRAVLGARGEKARRIQARHLLLGVLARERPDPAAELLGALGVDPARVRDLLGRPVLRGEET